MCCTFLALSGNLAPWTFSSILYVINDQCSNYRTINTAFAVSALLLAGSNKVNWVISMATAYDYYQDFSAVIKTQQYRYGLACFNNSLCLPWSRNKITAKWFLNFIRHWERAIFRGIQCVWSLFTSCSSGVLKRITKIDAHTFPP